MECPKCSAEKTYVVDSRQSKRIGGAVRRARVCYECDHRCHTYEILRDKAESAFKAQEALQTFIKQAMRQEER